MTGLAETGYSLESHLQDLLERFPALLTGDGTMPARYLLVAREMPIRDGHGATDRWNIDHLFVDQNAIPTFIECKRSSDPRLRREVVAQMLDYVANGIAYWSPGELRAKFERTCAERGLSADAVLADHIAADGSEQDSARLADDFWNSAERNLRDRKVRLLFVADRIPNELKRLVEFLNEEMPRIEVLAMNIRQFRIDGDSRSVLVPELIGATARAENVKDRPRRDALGEAEFLDKIAADNNALRSFYTDLWSRFQCIGGRLKSTPAGITLQLPTADPNGYETVAYCLCDYFQYFFAGLTNRHELREELRAELAKQSGGLYVTKGKNASTLNNSDITMENGEALVSTFMAVVQRLQPLLLDPPPADDGKATAID